MCAREDALRTWMRAKRVYLGLTQADVAELVGVDRYTIVKIETGKHGISWDLGCALILELSGAQPKRSTPSDPGSFALPCRVTL